MGTLHLYKRSLSRVLVRVATLLDYAQSSQSWRWVALELFVGDIAPRKLRARGARACAHTHTCTSPDPAPALLLEAASDVVAWSRSRPPLCLGVPIIASRRSLLLSVRPSVFG